MIKDKDKLIIAKLLLKITVIMLIISVCLKLVGFNLFETNYNSALLDLITKVIDTPLKKGLMDSFLLFIQYFVILKISCLNKKSMPYFIISVLFSAASIITQVLLFDFVYGVNPNLANILYFSSSFLYLILATFIIDFKFILMDKLKCVFRLIKNILLSAVLISIYQMIVLFLKNIIPSNRYDLVYDFLLNFDYILLLLFTYYFHLKNKTKVNNDFLFVIKILNNKLEKEDFIYYVDKIKASYADFSNGYSLEKIDRKSVV